MQMKILKYLTHLNHHRMLFTAHGPQHVFKKLELICKMKWGEGPHAWDSMLDYPRHFRVASPWNLGIFNSSGNQGKQKAATLLVSVGEIEPGNTNFRRGGVYWIPIHLSLLCMEISIQRVGGQKYDTHLGIIFIKCLDMAGVQKKIFYWSWKICR